MAIQYNENIKIAAPAPLDKRYLSTRTSGGVQVPYSATTEVNTIIISSERYMGLTVNVDGIEYWYKDGILDANLIEKKYDSVIPAGDFVTGATNLGFFSGFTGIQTLPITNLIDSTYNGSYNSVYNNYYLGADGIVHIDASPIDDVYRRGYVKTSGDVKSLIWSDYVSGLYLRGWILLTGDISELIGTSALPYLYRYYNATTTFPYTGNTWTEGSYYTNGSEMVVSTVVGTTTTGTTVTVGGPVYSHVEDNLMNLRTIISQTPEYIDVNYDEAFVYISGATSVLDGANIGNTGQPVFSQKSGNTLVFRRLVGSGDTVVTQTGDILNIYSNAAGADTITGATNLGTGINVYSGVTNRNLKFRTITGSGSTVVSQSGNSIVIYSTDSAIGTLTGTTNGISLEPDGRTIKLGGDLTDNTTINGTGTHCLSINCVDEFKINTGVGVNDTLLGVDKNGLLFSFSGGSVSFDDNSGLNYGTDYHTNYNDRSIPDVAFVTNSFLSLDQSTQQQVIGNQPIFNEGIIIGSTPTPSKISGHTNGKLYYDTEYKTVAVQMGDDINLQLGQESVILVYNPTGSIINDGSVVRLDGAHTGAFGSLIGVCLAKADSAICSKAIGVATQIIPIGGTGFITTRGVLHELNTLTSPIYSGMTQGDTLYLSAAIAGGITNTPPVAPNLTIELGKLVLKDEVNGKIFVNVTPKYALNDLADVNIASPGLDNVLKWNGSEWINGIGGAVSAGGGVNFYYATPIINDRTVPYGLDANGVGYGIRVASLSRTPVVEGGELISCAGVNNSTSAVVAWLLDEPIGREVIDPGSWKFVSWYCISTAVGVSCLINNMYQVVPITGSTINISNIGAISVTATISSNEFAGTYFTGGTNILNSSFLQTPSGIYQICDVISDNSVCIVIPNGTGGSIFGGTGNTWNKLFGATTTEINNTTYTCVETTLAEPAFSVSADDKLGRIAFLSSTNNVTLSMTFNGTERASYFQTPFITFHNDLAGLQGGTGNQRYHVDEDKYNVIQNTSGINTGDETTASIESKLTGLIDSHYHPMVGSGNTIVSLSGDNKTYIIYSTNPSSTEYVFDYDIVVSIAEGKTFGKYENGDTIPSSGKTAVDVIKLALSEALEPTVNLSTGSTNVLFGESTKTVGLNFSYTINTLNASVSSVALEWRRGNTGSWSGLTTNTGATTYSHSIIESNRFNTDVINYQYTVVDSEGATKTATVNVTPQAYLIPTISILLNGTLSPLETQNIREKGNVSSSPSGVITSNRILVDINAWTLERRYNGGSWTTIASASGLETNSVIIPSTLDVTVPTNATSIEYRITYVDEYTSGNGGNQSITFKYYSYWGYNTNITLTESQIKALMYKNFLSSDNLSWNDVNSPAGNYTYYAYPSTYPDFTSVIKNGVNFDFGAWVKLSNVNVINTYGEALDYKVWRTNATQAYSATDDIVIS